MRVIHSCKQYNTIQVFSVKTAAGKNKHFNWNDEVFVQCVCLVFSVDTTGTITGITIYTWYT